MPPRRRHLAALFLFAAFLVALGGSHAPAFAQTYSRWLFWTAPGDDGNAGRATRYAIRYSSNPISGTDTTAWWNAAKALNTTGKVPPPPGSKDSIRVTGLTIGVTYYAMIRTADEVPNWSKLSNLAVVTAVTGVEENQAPPLAPRIRAAPNPFETGTVLSFTLPTAEHTDVAAFDVNGRQVRGLYRGVLGPGEHRLTWDGRDDAGRRVASGIYFFRLRSGTLRLNTKVFRLR